ncbi:F0F1 ATP synthase subunit A [Candidatus Saccharibacteria bacterium]|nr:F0F1 ATP synthase subunit A [Candidatus Saccharibacteria bacterium]
MNYFAALDIHISLAPETVLRIGSFEVTNSMLTGLLGTIITLAVFFYVARQVKRGKTNRFVGLVQWGFESLLSQVNDVIGDAKLARKIAPLAIAIFFFVLINYWLGIIPGVGPITIDGIPVLRSLTADLNFTIALAIITMVAVQIYAIRRHGFFSNAGRYFRNPLKDPIGAFEGILELVGEFSRLVALSLRLFGNTFAGEVLLVLIAVLSGYAAFLSLPVVMVFELFIGFIQAYVFFMLTLIFTALAQEGHGEEHHDDSPTHHSSADNLTQIPARE